MTLTPTPEQSAKLRYNPETGELTWAHKQYSSYSGKRAGGISSGGYRSVTLDGRRYLEHRLIWFLVTGAFPINEIDHINGNRADNRWRNLREATKEENAWNRKDVAGVCFHKRFNKWQASIKVKGKQHFLGRFANREEARGVYLEAKERFHAHSDT